jgi:hypothetical protein
VHVGIDIFMNRHRFQLEILAQMIYERIRSQHALDLRFLVGHEPAIFLVRQQGPMRS